MKFTKRQQKFIDEIQATVQGPKLPSWLYNALTPLPTLLLLSLVWGHWFNGPVLLSDLVYGFIVLSTIISIIIGLIFLILISKTDDSETIDKVLFTRYAPIFTPKYNKILSVIYYLGGFVILAAMGHGWLAGFVLINGVISYLYHTVYNRDAKIRLTTIDSSGLGNIKRGPSV